jgi:hypothetical protein
MSCSELALSAAFRSSVVSVLGSCAAALRSSPRLCFFFFNYNHVYNGYGDHNISFTFKFFAFFLFSFFFCSHSRKGGAQLVSQRVMTEIVYYYVTPVHNASLSIWPLASHSCANVCLFLHDGKVHHKVCVCDCLENSTLLEQPLAQETIKIQSVAYNCFALVAFTTSTIRNPASLSP